MEKTCSLRPKTEKKVAGEPIVSTLFECDPTCCESFTGFPFGVNILKNILKISLLILSSKSFIYSHAATVRWPATSSHV